MRRGAWLALVVAAAGCGDDPLQRMRHQRKFEAYEENELFADGRAMRPLVEGTVPREATLPEVDGGAPRRVRTKAFLERGRRRFDIVCATCHGRVGDGQSIVARNMSLRQPPSLHRYREATDQHLYEVIEKGYGLMPSFAEIPPDERWAVVAYVRALQLSQHARLADVPPEARDILDRDGGP